MAKTTVDNCGALGRVNPLNRLERSNRRHWEYDQERWDAKLANRVYSDLLVFIERRYPGLRWLVLAEVLLTAGARAAAKAGVGDDEIVQFVNENKGLSAVPISGPMGKVCDAVGANEHALTTEGAD